MIVNRRRFVAGLAGAALPAAVSAEVLPLVPLPGNVAAPDFALPDISGCTHKLSDYRGRPVLVSFWAVWCSPCRRELGALAMLRDRLADAGIPVVAVNLGDTPERATAFLAEHPAPGLPILLDRDKSVAAAWHVQALPTAYAVSGAGVLCLGALGERDWLSCDIEKQLRGIG